MDKLRSNSKQPGESVASDLFCVLEKFYLSGKCNITIS